MDQPIDLDRGLNSSPLFTGVEASSARSWEDADLARAMFYQEIADRRAQLECAETLRRVRAL